MNKHAYMIIAHNELGLLQKLVSALDCPENDIYIHFDKSRYTEEVNRITAVHSKLTIVSEIAVHWGSYSMVRCELLLLKLATRTPHSYYHLLSGVDLPLKSPREIYSFFESSGKQFVHFFGPEFLEKHEDWVYYRHISAEKFRSGRNGLENKWFEVSDRLGVRVQKLFGKKKKLHFTELRKGTQWFSITEDFAKYILSQEDLIEADFKEAYIPDELFVQTVLVNSPWRDQQANPDRFKIRERTMRYIDWNRGSPYTFTIADLEELRGSGCMFARKFSSAKDSKIIDALTNEIG